MSLNAVQTYVKSQLDDLVSAQLPNARAFIEPPVAQESDTPLIYIWGGHQEEKRQTMQRGHGFKHVHYDCELWVVWPNDPEAANADTEFAILVEAVKQKLRGTPIPVPITDSVTGVLSYLLDIGENFTVDYGRPAFAADQRFLWHFALVTTHITESIMA